MLEIIYKRNKTPHKLPNKYETKTKQNKKEEQKCWVIASRHHVILSALNIHINGMMMSRSNQIDHIQNPIFPKTTTGTGKLKY